MIRRFTLGIGVALAALAVAAAALAHSDAMKLRGTVGPGYTIKLTKNGKTVRTLRHGTYTITISDRASIHNFVIEQEKGGKFEKDLTSVPFTGTKTVKVRLRAGKWKFYCKSHESQMFGFFTVK